MSEEKWWEILFEEPGTDWWDAHSGQHVSWWDGEKESGEDRWWEKTEGLEEGDWIEGEAGVLPIEWYHITDWIPVADDREIINAIIEPKTKAHEDGGFFDAFSLKRSLEFLKLYGAERVDLCLEETNDALEIPLFGAHEDSMVKSIYILPEGNITGHNENYMKLILRNKKTGGDISTKTYMEGNDVTAWNLDQMGPINKTHGLISQGEGTSLIVEKHGDGFIFPRSVIIILWDYATDSDFKEAGL